MAYWAFEEDLKLKETKDDEPRDEIERNYRALLDVFHESRDTKTEKVPLPPPKVVHAGKASKWTNFEDFVHLLKRPRDHLTKFFEAESAMDVRIAEGKGLIFPHRVKVEAVEKLLRSYIGTFVACTCRSLNTEMRRMEGLRHYERVCLKCGQTSALPDISRGYRALQKGQRREERRV